MGISFVLGVALAISLSTVTSRAATPMFHTIQVGSYEFRKNAIEFYEQLGRSLPEGIHDLIRVERVGRFDAVRIGDFLDESAVREVTSELDEHGIEWVMRLAPIRGERIVVPPKVRLHGKPPAHEPGPEVRGKVTRPLEAVVEDQNKDRQAEPDAGVDSGGADDFSAGPPAEPAPAGNSVELRYARVRILEAAERILNQSSDSAAEDAGKLLAYFMNLECSDLDVTEAALDNLRVLAEETARDKGVDLRATWRNDPWDSEDGAGMDRNTVRFGLIWDVISDGLLDSRREARDYRDELRLARMDANASRRNDLFACRDVLMSLHFAGLRLGPLHELRRLQQLRLKELVALYRSGRIFLDDVVEARAGLSETEEHIETIRRGMALLPECRTPAEFVEAPVLNLNMAELMVGLSEQAVADKQRLQVREDILRRRYDETYDVDLELFTDFGAEIDREGAAKDVRVGMDLRIPIVPDDDERLLRSAMRRERVSLAKDREDRRFDLVRRAGAYREKITDALVMHHRLRLTRERLRRAFAAHRIEPDTPDPLLGETLTLVAKQAIEHLKVRVEMLGVKESLYRRLLNILTEARLDYEQGVVAAWNPASVDETVRPGERSVYVWSETFNYAPNEYILELFRVKGVHRALISAGRNVDSAKLAGFISEAPSRGIEVSLVYSSNQWIDREGRDKVLERIGRDAKITGRVHLDVEPWTLPDYRGNESLYQDALVELIGDVRERLGPEVQLGVSVTPKLEPRTIADISRIADRLYVMVYGKNEAGAIVSEFDRFADVPGHKLVLAVRPSDFSGERALEDLLDVLAEEYGIDNFALHDLEGYMALAAKVET
jgi:hypothetical protein